MTWPSFFCVSFLLSSVKATQRNRVKGRKRRENEVPPTAPPLSRSLPQQRLAALPNIGEIFLSTSFGIPPTLFSCLFIRLFLTTSLFYTSTSIAWPKLTLTLPFISYSRRFNPNLTKNCLWFLCSELKSIRIYWIPLKIQWNISKISIKRAIDSISDKLSIGLHKHSTKCKLTF